MNRDKKLAIATAIIAFFIFIINTIAMKNSWYFFIWWFDMPMHLLGGFFVALLFSSIFVSSRFFKIPTSSRKFFLSVMVSVLIVGIIWEVFELSVEKLIQFADLVSLRDSASDIFYDLAGGILGALIGLSVYKRKIKSTISNQTNV